MSDLVDINDRLNTAAEKAENGAQIIHDVANGDKNTEVQTESGQISTLAKVLKNIEDSASIDASVSAEPNKVPRADDSGKLDPNWLPGIVSNSEELSDYAALRAYSGKAATIRITAPGLAGTILPDPSVTSDEGGTTFLDGLGRGWRRSFKGTVHADWFDDGSLTDAAVYQSALNTGAAKVLGLSRDAVTDASLAITTDGQTLVMQDNCSITLATIDPSAPVINALGRKSKIYGGSISYTLRTLKFSVVLTGEGSKLKNCEVFFATKSTLASTDGSIPYNCGGVSMVGDFARVEKCDIYNHQGIGVVVYGLDCRIIDNDIHDNITGIHGTVAVDSVVERYLYVFDNRIYDNNVQHSSGADGILTSYLTLLKMSRNVVTNNGEHGTYIYSVKSVITDNHFIGNYYVGLKVRASKYTVLSKNIVIDNQASGDAGGDIVVQLQDNPGIPDDNSKKVTITENQAFSKTGVGINVAFITAGLTLKDLIVSKNQARMMQLAYTANAIISENIVDEDLIVAAATSAAPVTQSGAKVKGNICGGRLIVGRAVSSEFEGNTCAEIDTTGSPSGGKNKFIGNTATAQTKQISRGIFEEFSRNDINCAGMSAQLLPQDSVRANNDNKNISFNKFRKHSQPVIADTTSGISGNNNRLIGNEFDSPNHGVSMWGTGHTLMGNVNIGGGPAAYMGASNSWFIGNSPKVTLRAEATGNQNI